MESFSLPFYFRAIQLGISFPKVSRTLTKNYAKKFPPSPKSVAEILAFFSDESIQNTIGMTLRDENEATTPLFKHAFECEAYSFCVFASDDIINIIKAKIPAERNFFLDGTFKICPNGIFKQLLVISVDISSQVCLFEFSIMSLSF